MDTYRNKVNTSNPREIILFIETRHPELKGLCIYDDMQLKSLDEKRALFHFDPIHKVVQVKIFNN
jgi:hypothetical protein